MPPTPTAVEHRCDASSLAGAVDAAIAGIITPILVVDAEFSHAAVSMVREARAEMLMKAH